MAKGLSRFSVFTIATGTISSGLFVLPALAYQMVGSGLVIAYALAGLAMIPSLLVKLELATALPKAGGTYFYLDRILGRSIGVVAGFANWFAIALKGAFALAGMGVFALLIAPALGENTVKLIAVGLCLAFTILNLVSVHSSGKAQSILVFVILFILFQFVFLGYPKSQVQHFTLSFNPDLLGIIQAAGMVFISYGGITKVTSIAEEVRDPKKNLVGGMIMSYVVVLLTFLAVVSVVVGVLPLGELGNTLTPVSTAAGAIFADLLVSRVQIVITALAAILAFVTTANASILAASRVPMAMSRDRILPPFWARVSSRETPYVGIIATGLFMSAIVLFFDIGDLAKVASFFMLLIFFFECLSLIVIRQTGLVNYRPAFKVPAYPFVPILGALVYLGLMVTLGGKVLLIGAVFIVLALLWYLIYVRTKGNHKSALKHMLERLAKPDYPAESEELERELLGILLERDEITEDRFDRIIREAMVIDLDRPLQRLELFQMLGEGLSERWGAEAEVISRKLEEREALASTMIYPGVALPHTIPHIRLEGETKFDIVLIRNRHGIHWGPNGEVVYTAFCMMSSKDERDFHLKALVSIAQILQDPQFSKDWLEAQSAEELRTVVLLIKRRRHNQEAGAETGTLGVVGT